MNKLRLSYSLLKLWIDGRIEDVINHYYHISKEATDRMNEGTRFDEYVEEYAITHKTLPPELGNIKLYHPKPKYTLVLPYNDKLDIKGEMDIWDRPILYEIKSSIAKMSSDFADDFQISFYFLLLEMNKEPASRAWIFRYNPITLKYDSTLVWKSERRLHDAKNLIETFGVSLYDYLNEKGVLKDEQGKPK